jgi:hypothetical protein
MSAFRIAPFEGRAEIFCENSEALYQALVSLNTSFKIPTLVNVHDEHGCAAIVGLGCEVSTLQLIDEIHGETHRTSSNLAEREVVEFSYQGEATFVKPKFLVPLDLAIRAVVVWVAEHKLMPAINWLSSAFPPRI